MAVTPLSSVLAGDPGTSDMILFTQVYGSRHIDYIHFNPVKHGLVADPDEWPYSTWHRWKKELGRPLNITPDDWKPVHLGER